MTGKEQVVRDASGVPDGRKRGGPKRMIVAVLSVIVLAYAGFTGLIYVSQDSMVYHPKKQIEALPSSVNLPYEDLRLRTSDGADLHAWYVPAKKERGVLLFCHGNAGNISHRLPSLVIFERLGLSVLIFDYRGYGQSTGKPSEQGTYEDAATAWRYLTETRHIPPERILVFGRSLGGPIAARTAAEFQPRALILESTFTSITDVGRAMYPLLPVSLMSRYRYPTSEYLARIHCPVLVVHSPEDDLIPFALGQRNYALASEPKSFVQITGTHNDGFLTSGVQYPRGLDQFLSRPDVFGPN